ncbi:hypothetical protein F4778DRAFT_783426 [Xylariomycetidae sp. FL2044]|nr:hypothetical protein F4778DRAFT_783426 [Xylariomycetidae sp. FL2044]
MPTIVLISGATRGLGRGLVEAYVAKSNHTVIAANRNTDHPLSKSLHDLPRGPGSSLITIQIDATVETDALDAIGKLPDYVDHLDLVIASAGIADKYPKVSDLKIDDLLHHLRPNVFGVCWLFQATLLLLSKADHPSWVTIEKALVPVDESVAGVVKVIDGASKQSHGDRFWDYTGKEVPW